MKPLTEDKKKFLVGLEKLTRETGIKIYGCGCCGSPDIIEVKITSDKSGYGIGYAGEISWIDPSDKDDWEDYSKTIIKK